MAATAQLRHALLRLGEVLRTEAWRETEEGRLHPSQARILQRLAGAPAGVTVTALALDLGVRQPTASRSVDSLVRKGLAEKAPGPGRAVSVTLAPGGRDWLARSGGKASALDAAIDALSPAEQAALLASATKMIRTLQLAGAISPQRLCVTCVHFRPNAHAGRDAPHHCALVDAPFGNRELRLDCPEHQPADADQADQAWTRWREGPDAPSAATDGTPLFATHPQRQTGA